MIDARTLALLVRNEAISLDDAADAIEQYTKAEAARAVHEAVGRAYDHIIAIIEAPLVRPEVMQ